MIYEHFLEFYTKCAVKCCSIKMRYKFQYQFLMKKTRADRSQVQAITLSSKRGSLNQEQLFVPYKIDWKASPLQSVDNNGGSRAFFQNMKAELSNIKNDFEKLIKKEGTCINDKESEAKSVSKPKCQSAYKKDVKRGLERYPQNEKLEIVMNTREDNDFFKILNLEKNLPCSSANDYRNICSKTINVKDLVSKQSKTSPFDAIQLQRNQRAQSSRGERPVIVESARVDDKDKEISSLKENVSILQRQLKQTLQERDFTRKQAQRCFVQNGSLKNSVQQLSSELSLKVNYILNQQQVLLKLQESVRCLQQQTQQRNSIEQQLSNQRNFYTQRINELMFHNQNLGVNNMQLANENQMLKESCDNLQRFVQQLQKRCESINMDNKRKVQYMQRDIQEYQKREDMFSKQIEKLNLQLIKLQNQPKGTATSLGLIVSAEGNDQISQLKDEIRHLTKQVAIQKEIHSTLAKRYEEQIASLRIEELSRDFEEKINKLIEQNCKLKSKVNHCESTLESTKEQNQSYLQQIALYEERDNKKVGRQLSCTEWEQMTEKIEALQEENKRLSQELQFRGLKAENEQGDTSLTHNESLIRMANLQLFQNQKLKQTIRELSSQLKNAQQKVQSLSNAQLRFDDMTSPIDQNRKVEQLLAEAQRKSGQINGLKQLVFRVLVEKVNKLEDQEQMEYYLREIQQRRQLFC